MCLRALTLQQEEPLQWEAQAPQRESRPSSLQLEKARVQQQRASTAKNKFLKSYRKKENNHRNVMVFTDSTNAPHPQMVFFKW